MISRTIAWIFASLMIIFYEDILIFNFPTSIILNSKGSIKYIRPADELNKAAIKNNLKMNSTVSA
jgi:hypothetical protein